MQANARPPYTIARPRRRSQAPFKAGDTIGNMRQAVKQAAAEGYKVGIEPRDPRLAASASPKGQYVNVNPASPFWRDPAANMRAMRRRGHVSTSDPRGAILHEVGHLKDSNAHYGAQRKGPRVASRVSRYATESPREFVAEVYAGLRTGRKYDRQVMSAYRTEAGLPRVQSRRRSRLR